ncbi:response regulator [Acinetobacter sp. YH12039]|uniref:response regulator n=1 Tax=Acinetobacter sp. YH12039 TaxID=2601047 RepID=UPI0015D3CAA4|nr:response regulator [Acinetobacter sp. YH12039]
MRVLLVEDDSLLAKATARGLDQMGFVVDIASTAEQAYHFLVSYHYHFILLDLGLPDRNGIEILKSLRRKKNQVGIIILTAQDQVNDRITGLEAGADDFVVKPYDLHEVVARIHAVLRRISGEVGDLIQVGNISINKASKQVLLNQVEIELTHKEFHLLELFTLNRGRVISRENIENSFYAYDVDVSSNVVQVYIHNLRRKLGKNIIRTVQGFGYIMDEQH